MLLEQIGRPMKNGKWKEESGAALVEFAIVVLPLVILLFGIIEFSLILYDKAVLTNASREGARFASLPGKTETEIKTFVRNRVGTYLITFGSDTFDDDHITLERSLELGQYVRRVTLNYVYEFLLLPGLSTDFDGTIALTAATVMRDEDQTTR